MDYSLNNWLYRLGLARQRKAGAVMKTLSSKKGIKLTRPGFDYNGGQLIDVSAEASYDKEEGVLEYQVAWWRYLPYTDTKDANKQYVLRIQGKRDPAQDEDEPNPTIIPEQIWINGQPVFNKTGATGDPNQAPYQKMINTAWDLGNQINVLLGKKDEVPVSAIAKIFNGGDGKGNLAKEVFGTAPSFKGLDANTGGFQDNPLQLAYTNASARQDGTIQFNQCDDEQLQSLLGFRFNSLDKDSAHTQSLKVPASDPDSGVAYNTEVSFKIDPKTKKRVFTMSIAPGDVPEGHVTPEPFEVLCLEFSRPDKNTAVLDKAEFMQVPRPVESMFEEIEKVGFFQDANINYFAKEAYPPYQDLAAKYRLENQVSEMPLPPPLKKKGGEMLWIPLNGSSMKKKGGLPTDGIGGGNLMMSRGLKSDGTVSEVSVLVGLPFIPAGSSNDYDGILADLSPWWKDVKYIVIDHDHFDHSSLEAYVQKGFFKPKPGETPKEIVCTEEVKYIMEQRFKSVGVKKEYWPQFKLVRDVENIPVKDEDGNTRMWVQFCKNGARHSAQTATQIITGCYNDDVYHQSYFFYNDAFDLSEKGWEFAKQGPRALAKEKGVTAKKVDKDIDVVFHDPTGCTVKGTTTTSDQFKDTWRSIMDVLGTEDKATLFAPFSTNHEEYQNLIELFSEPSVKRNYTFVGRNAEIRGTALNKFGVNPWMDLRYTELDQKIIDEVYKRLVHESANVLQAKSEENGEVFQKAVYLRNAKKELREDPDFFVKLAKARMEQLRVEFEDEGKNPKSSTERYILKRMLKSEDHVFRFPDNGLYAYNMYQAIVEHGFQQEAVMNGSRTSHRAKEFRDNPGHFAAFTTGPIGSQEEYFASLSRYKEFWSLFDTDNKVRSTGFQMDAKDSVICVPQPAPPIEGAEDAQEQLMRDLVKQRDVTVICAFRSGFKVYNPKGMVNKFLNKFEERGFKTRYDAANDQIIVEDQPAHIHGHGFRNDLLKIVKNLPAKLHEVIHIPGLKSFQEFRGIVQQAKKTTSITDPDDHVARKFTFDKKTKEASLPVHAYLQQSFQLLRLYYQFGRPWRPIVELVRQIVPRDDGTTRRDGMSIRTGDGEFEHSNAVVDFNKAVNPSRNPERKGYKHRKYNPSDVTRKDEGQRPPGRMTFGRGKKA